MVDRKRIELFPKACKAPVLPLSPTAHIYKDLTPIYSVCQIKNSTLSYLDQIRPGQTYRGVSCPSRCWSQSPTRTLFYPRHLGGFMGIFNPQIISRTQPLVIVSDLAKFKPLPLSDIKMVGVTGLAPAAS